ncbi:C4-dicarboxylate ABC transporter substrate-binding protein [Burkholderiaceae bacterium FT117]|uniref:TAXI family TRAP transporter solute-binding subunit n=1 Tax=Zeimonas sediminis TaxID=2944268 RepID=UPI002342D1AC|nr:TAXI family TRAP transporter solute-binding subunit [Zeimonas sediminis]MCM5571435.1 C4-dicarboxylate ABC transporter substrate-binding protein [Zeimonas sediminis]
MPRFLRNAILNARDFALTFGPFALLAVALLWAAFWFLQPTPPGSVTLATGQPQGAYAEFGRRYAEWLGRHGIEVRLRQTQGATENLELLRDPASGVSVAFVQGGADTREPPPGDSKGDGLVALGSLFFEPLWLFYREDSARRLLRRDTLDSLGELRGWRLNIGPPGSGVPNLIARLFEANGLRDGDLSLHRLGQTPAVVELLAGRIDAVAFASAPEAPIIRMLLQTPGVRLLDVPQAEAYSRRFQFLSPVVLPRGVVDLAQDVPPADVRLVAPTAMLVAHEDLHPALAQLFVQAARAIHGESGWFQRRGEFPSERSLEWPLAGEAERYFRSGTPWLQRYLPFWLANLVDRMWLALLSIVAVLIPLSRIVPPLYEFRVRSRIFRWYGQLRRIEDALSDPAQDRRDLVGQLDALDARVERLAVPLSHTDALYALRGHIRLVRARAEAGPEQAAPGRERAGTERGLPG